MNQSPIDTKVIARKAWRDSLQDGLVELAAGVAMFLLSILIRARTFTFVAILVVFGPLIVRRLKERFTYPRIGYVAFPEKSRKQSPIMALLVGVAVIAIGAVIILVGKANDTGAWYRWTPLLPAITLQGPLLPLAIKSGLKRYYFLAALILLLGIGATQLGLPGHMDNLWVYLMTIGAILIIWGVVLLVTFLRKYPVRAEERRDGE